MAVVRRDSNGCVADFSSVRFTLRERHEKCQHSKNKNYQSDHRQWTHVLPQCFLSALTRRRWGSVTTFTVSLLVDRLSRISYAYGRFGSKIRHEP